MAARSLGLSYAQTMRYVVLPQAIRRVIPPLLNDFIGLQKDTAIVYIIGIGEAVLAAQNYWTASQLHRLHTGRHLLRAADDPAGALHRQPHQAARGSRAGSGMNEAFVDVDHVWKAFLDNQVLKDVSLQVGLHEVVCLIGASGSGKSTLLRCINLLETIDSGSITFDGQNLTVEKPNVNKLRQQIGIVFQSYNLFPHMTVLQNVTLAPRKTLGHSRSRAEARAYELLNRIGLLEKAEEFPMTVSRAASSNASRSCGHSRWTRS